MTDRSLFVKDGKMVRLPVAAGAVVELGHMAAVNATGYLVPAEDSTGLTVVGVATETADNAQGADGDLFVRVYRAMSFLFENNGLTQADVGKTVYVDNSVTLKASGNVAAGKCLAVDDPEGVQVWID